MSKKAVRQLALQFDDNNLVSILFGECGVHLSRIEDQLSVQIHSKGNEVMMSGTQEQLERAKNVLETLWERVTNGLKVGLDEVDAAIRIVDNTLDPATREMARVAFKEPQVKVKKGNNSHHHLTARTPQQAAYLNAMKENRIIFGVGPAGTGKTYLAVAYAAMMLEKGDVKRIVLCRPAVEAGENLGFLPGDMQEKVDPYLRPLYDAMHDMMTPEKIVQHLANGNIEVVPLAFMRGRTLADACIVLDEAQNTTTTQIKMALTRLGQNSIMIITGDPTQTDLPRNIQSGLNESMIVLEGVDDIAYIRFTDEDVVRDPLVAKIVKAYDWYDKKREQESHQ